MPTEEQIRKWKDLEFRIKRGQEYEYLKNGLPLDREHEDWLQMRVAAAADLGGYVGSTYDSSGATSPQEESTPPLEQDTQHQKTLEVALTQVCHVT